MPREEYREAFQPLLLSRRDSEDGASNVKFKLGALRIGNMALEVTDMVIPRRPRGR